MPWRSITVAALVSSVAALAGAGAGGHAAVSAPGCAPSALEPGYVSRVMRALRAKDDVWGNELLVAPGGPTYAQAQRYLEPLLRAKGANGVELTTSGVHYVPFSGPVGVNGAGSMALHVADGSQILSQRVSGRSLTIAVGDDGRHRDRARPLAWPAATCRSSKPSTSTRTACVTGRSRLRRASHRHARS